MSLLLYHYVHCPFCIRVRMTLGFLELPYISHVLPYNDEKTPLELSGKKMLPILVAKGKAMNESLDIMTFLDDESRLQIPTMLTQDSFREFEARLSSLGSLVHSLAMPYWIYTPEFDKESRAYFQKKKEEKRGPFGELVKHKKDFISQLQALLSLTEKELSPFYQSAHFGPKDILLAAHLWGLYVLPEFQFSSGFHEYLQRVGEICHFNYHQDFWS